MNNRFGMLMAAALCVICLGLGIAIYFGSMIDRTGKSLVGKPVPQSVSAFLPTEELSGETFVMLSDMYVDECNDRASELFNRVTELSQNGVQTRMLHAGRHGFPKKSYQDAVESKRGPTQKIIADQSVLYADKGIRYLLKPCVIRVVEGEVAEVLVGDQFEEWMQQN